VNPPATSQGCLSSRIAAKRIATEAIVGFLARHLGDLPTWRGTRHDQNEDYYNQRLERLLSVRARQHLDAFQFSRETIHETPGRPDIGVFPAEEEGLTVRGRTFGPDEPVYTMECKRLPQPPDRRREYLTSEGGEKPRGAVQRYKLGVHGAGLDAAGIVAYVQEGELESWRKTINNWVSELVAKPVDDARWTEADRLKPHRKFKARGKTLVSRSVSSRVHGRSIGLTHFSVDLRAPPQPQFDFAQKAN
jgi:hypothetical protein